MRRILFTLIFVLLAVPQALAQTNKPQDQQSPTPATSEAEQPKNEVDRMLEDAKKRGEPVYGVCISEDCPSAIEDVQFEKGRAIHLAKPGYPELARKAHVAGQIKVKVIIGEEGTVIAAAAVDGHPLLYGVSVAAARDSTFTPTRINGQPVKVVGVLQYNFVAQ
jgi:outer membrane biosynthesis protein TonB